MADIPYMARINNTPLPGMKKCAVEQNKLWTDANRNMAGDLRATFIGLFPKLALEFRSTTRAEMKVLVGLLNQPSFNVSWWDEQTETIQTGLYYAGDYKLDLMIPKSLGRYEPFNVNLIPFNKKT